MRLMLMWPGGGPAFGELCDALKGEGHEIVYVVSEQSEHLAPMTAFYHDHYDAWDGKRAPALAAKDIPPVTRKELRDRYELESLVLTMMNKRYDRAPVEQRKHIYHEMLAYWIYVLDLVRPQAIIFQIIPHSVYNYIVFELARERGIHTFMFEETVVGGRLMSYRDFWTGNRELRDRLTLYLKHPVSLKDLDHQIQAHWNTHQPSAGTSQPWYMKEQLQKAAGMPLWRIRVRALWQAMKEGTALKLIGSFIYKKFQPNLRTEYVSVQKPADLSKAYIYFPLQFQPERTTSPQGDVYHDQLLALQVLSSALPEGWEILVKEHPAQWASRYKTSYNSVRWIGYYRTIAKIPRTRLVPIDTNSYDLIDHSRAVAVVTGTAGWEAVMRGKRTLVFGTVWYRDCPGVHHIETIEDCRRVIGELDRSPLNKKDIFAFLKAFENVSVRTHVNQDPHDSEALSEEEGMRAIRDLLLKELRSV